MVAYCVSTILSNVRMVVTCQAMEIPLASAKMTTSAVMKVFMAGLGVWPEWLWNTVTVGARANNEREGIHTLRYFQVLYLDPLRRRRGYALRRRKHLKWPS